MRRVRQRREASAAAELDRLNRQVAEAVSQGNFAEAEAVARAVMDAHADAGLADEVYLTAWTSWANAMQRRGQHAGAAREYTAMIDTVGPMIGHDHARVMIWRFSRGSQFGVLGRYVEAESDCRLAMEMSARVQAAGYGTHFRLLVVYTLVSALIGRGAAAEAESVARMSIAEAASITDLPSPVVIRLRWALASSLNAQERYAEAEEVMRNLGPVRAVDIASYRLILGTAQLGLGRAAEAEVSARESVTSAEEFYGPLHYTTLRAGTLLGAAFARQSNCDEARRQLRANAAAWTEHFGDAHPRTVEARRELAKTM
jgi:hypothetical protein